MRFATSDRQRTAIGKDVGAITSLVSWLQAANVRVDVALVGVTLVGREISLHDPAWLPQLLDDRAEREGRTGEFRANVALGLVSMASGAAALDEQRLAQHGIADESLRRLGRGRDTFLASRGGDRGRGDLTHG